MVRAMTSTRSLMCVMKYTCMLPYRMYHNMMGDSNVVHLYTPILSRALKASIERCHRQTVAYFCVCCVLQIRW